MNRICKATLALSLALAVSGCAQALWQKFNDTESARYVGHPVDQLLGEWGAPTALVSTDSGYYYEFHFYESGIYDCRAQVWTDRQKVVNRLVASGQNGCVG